MVAMEMSGSFVFTVYFVFVISFSGVVAEELDGTEPIVFKMDFCSLLDPKAQRWVDEFLRWDPREFKNLQELPLKPSTIWNPDIRPLPIKGGDTGWTDPSTATVVSSGTVSSVESTSYYVYCDIDVSRWPYESFECVLTLQSEAYKGPELNVYIMNHKIPELKYYEQNQDWKLISMSSARVSSETFESKYFVVNLEYSFVLKRDESISAAFVVFPAIVFSVVHLALFSLDKESSVRLILCCVSVGINWLLLMFATKAVPNAGGSVPTIITFYKYSLLTTSLTFIWTIVVHSICNLVSFPYWLYVATLKLHGHRYLSYLLPYDGNMRYSSNLGTEDASTLVAQAERENNQWRNITEFADRVLFITCTLVYLCLYMAYIPS